MMRGFSLPALLLAMLLGSSCIMLALTRYQSVRQAVRQLQQPVAEHQAMRILLAELAQDLQQHGQAGCWQMAPPGQTGDELSLAWGGPAWPIWHLEVDHESGQLQHLMLNEQHVPAGGLPTLLLASCTRLDRLQEGRDFSVQTRGLLVRLALLPGRRVPLSGSGGHHVPSLMLMPLVERRYRLRDGMLWRDEQQPLLPLRGFSFRQDQNMWQLKLLPADASQPVWPLVVASRQRGMAMLLVMVLMLAGLLLLGSVQRLLLDEGRQINQQRHWLQSLYLAEYGLQVAEQQVHGLARLPGYQGWFREGCQFATSALEWRKGLCLPAQPGTTLQPAWQRRHPSLTHPRLLGQGQPFLAPCNRQACRSVSLPVWFAGTRQETSYCPADPRIGPIRPSPCYLVELLDAEFRGGLFRITVRAWGHNSRSSTTLQSYYVAQGAGERLSWRRL
ncbi:MULTISPECIES: pilus assembly protein [unclassified Paludibacterium]|uniref:pilus assembly protein n=1 Tax=unclassified Paludibacterium TaxID=2618429 RepID=UPI001C045D0E|nr:pilus assembly protein [Paludibacterium sp. B53371]